MVVLLAVAVTAVVVAACATAIVTHRVRSHVNEAIGGRAGADPVAEHRRMLAAANDRVTEVETRVELMEVALDAMSAGVIVTDAGGTVLARNGLASAISPRSHEQTLVNAAATELLAAARTGNPVDRELEVFGPPRRVLYLHAVPIASGAEIVGALAVIDDVTDHHRIDQLRRDFIANLSHELRTPVGAVSLLAEMLLDEEDAETRSQLNHRLMLELSRMTNTIDDLLELSRIESDTQNYSETIVVQDLIVDALARTRVAAEARAVEVGSVVPTEPIEMRGNHDQLLSATVNLIDNAVKYSEPGDSVSVRSYLDDDMIALIVQDTGRGIPARDLDRIFERFYRVDRSRDTTTGGTGIGLSIVRHVALNHGGTVGVESVEGEGSTFRLDLPVVVPQRLTDEVST